MHRIPPKHPPKHQRFHVPTLLWRSAVALLLIAPLLLLSGCGGNGDGNGSIAWQPCGDNLQCGSLTVPLDYSDPGAGTIQLALVKLMATDPSQRIGSIVVDPGGPGGSGVDFVTQAGTSFFPAALRERFDIVGFDPRGVGRSDPVNYPYDPSAFFATDLTPDNENESRTLVDNSRRMAEDFRKKNGDLLRHVGTADVVRDLERIRIALGDAPLNYMGFSYGTKIGALYAEKFPTHIRTMVLDSVLPPSLENADAVMGQAVGIEQVMGDFLAWCSAGNGCTFGNGDPGAAYTALMEQIDRHPLSADGRTLGPGLAAYGVDAGLSSERFWPYLGKALTAAANGDPTPLLALADLYLERHPDGSYDNIIAAEMAVMCIDGPWPSPSGFETLEQQSTEQFHYFGAFNINTFLPCAFWKVKPVSQPEIVRAAGSPPILVIGVTHDPWTPYDWGKMLTGQMESAVLLTLEGEGHVAMGRQNPCIDGTVSDYLIDLTVPANGKRCQSLPAATTLGAEPKTLPQRWIFR